jgi:hypothetical protein
VDVYSQPMSHVIIVTVVTATVTVIAITSTENVLNLVIKFFVAIIAVRVSIVFDDFSLDFVG